MERAKGASVSLNHELRNKRKRITESLTNISGNVLDYGCGTGAQITSFLDSAATLYGTDIYKDKKILKGFKFLEKSKLKKNFFNVIVSYDTLEHVENEKESLKEIYDTLKTEGCLIIAVPQKWWIFEAHGAYLPLLKWNRVPFFSWLPKKLHSRWAKARIYTKKDLITVLENNNFKVIETVYLKAPMDHCKPKWLQKLMRKTIFNGDTTKIPFLATNVVAFAIKER